MKTRYGAWINLPGISTKEVAQIREVRLDSNVVGVGSGKTKREAEQMAAKEALALFDVK